MKEQLKEQAKQMNRLISEVEKSLKKAPKGSLVLSKSNGVTQYYHKTERPFDSIRMDHNRIHEYGVFHQVFFRYL